MAQSEKFGTFEEREEQCLCAMRALVDMHKCFDSCALQCQKKQVLEFAH